MTELAIVASAPPSCSSFWPSKQRELEMRQAERDAKAERLHGGRAPSSWRCTPRHGHVRPARTLAGSPPEFWPGRAGGLGVVVQPREAL